MVQLGNKFPGETQQQITEQIQEAEMFTIKTWLYFSFAVVVICALAPLSYAENINCSSEDGHRHYCSVDTRGGVQMIRQRSDSACIEGQTWGFDRQGIWVDRGCRADFSTGGSYGNGGYGNGGYGGGGSQLVNCSSEDGHRHVCPINTDGRVRLEKQRSGSACIEGRTWGYNNREIWVDRGCRGDFTVDARDDHDWHRGHGDHHEGHGDRPEADQFINCSSEDGGRKYCPTDTRGRVKMIKQRSGSECRQGYSWGYDRGGIWVDHGCRADFQVVR